MTPALLDAPQALLPDAPRALLADAPAAPPAGGRRLTLEERLQTVWRTAQREGGAECPVCHAAMRAEGATARCGGCGSVLS